jgi:NYN domain
MKYEELGGGFIKKREKRVVGLFIDGTGLDRATRRINRKVDMSALVRGVTSGLTPVVARYYTLVPYEDDSRQRAFLDAVARAGLSVIVKRLPPKGITRQVSVDLEMASDIVAFSLGLSSFSKENEYMPADHPLRAAAPASVVTNFGRKQAASQSDRMTDPEQAERNSRDKTLLSRDADLSAQRSLVVVCPSREISYPLGMAKDLGCDTTSADFGQFNTGDILKSAAKWIDLSDSETIWRD